MLLCHALTTLYCVPTQSMTQALGRIHAVLQFPIQSVGNRLASPH